MPAVRTDGSAVRLEEVRRARPATGEVLVRVRAVMVDRRDGEHRVGPHPVRLDAQGRRTLGRHVAGTVAAPGAGVDGWPLGRPVALRPETAVRQGWHVPGIEHEGGLAEYVVAPADALVPLPRDLPFCVGAVLPLAARAHSMLEHARLGPGDAVGIWGAGSLGACAIAVARVSGAAPLVVVDPDGAARAAALELGADVALDPGDPDLADRVRAVTGGRGLDVVLHASPQATASVQSREAAAPDGRVVLAGPAAPTHDDRWDGRTLSGPPRTAPGSLPLVAHLASAGRLWLPVPPALADGLAGAAAALDAAGRAQHLAPHLVVL